MSVGILLRKVSFVKMQYFHLASKTTKVKCHFQKNAIFDYLYNCKLMQLSRYLININWNELSAKYNNAPFSLNNLL